MSNRTVPPSAKTLGTLHLRADPRVMATALPNLTEALVRRGFPEETSGVGRTSCIGNPEIRATC